MGSAFSEEEKHTFALLWDFSAIIEIHKETPDSNEKLYEVFERVLFEASRQVVSQDLHVFVLDAADTIVQALHVNEIDRSI